MKREYGFMEALARFFYPPRCVLCEKILDHEKNDICPECLTEAHVFYHQPWNIPHIKSWVSLWQYTGKVRDSLVRYKFWHRRSYSVTFGRELAKKLLGASLDYDVITWVPISPERKRKRGYDQGQLLAMALGRELQRKPAALLRKIRNAPPQSGISDAAERRANVLGAYQPINCDMIQNKTVLLLDDVLTTGSTASECAKTLLIGGAKDVYLATIGVADKK